MSKKTVKGTGRAKKAPARKASKNVRAVKKTKPAAKKAAAKKSASKTTKSAVRKRSAAVQKVKAKAVARKATAKKATRATSSSVKKKASPAKKPAASKAVTPVATKRAATPVSTKSKSEARARLSKIVLPEGYRPSEDETFMNDKHRAYFRKRLLDWKEEIQRQTRETRAILNQDSTQHADLADRATSETDRTTELRTRDRQRKLIAKIDAALARIEDGSYGYCEDTGEPIGIRRLDARPIATLSVEAQERHERRERVYREE